MRRSLPLLLLVSCLSFGLQAQDTYLEEALQKWENATTYTLETLALIPEDQLDYKPVADVRSFRDQTMHLLQNMIWLSSTYLKGGEFEGDLEKEDYSKAEILEMARAAFAFSHEALKKVEPHDLRSKVKFFAGPMNIRQIIQLMNDHLTDHRGQIIIYLRMKGIKPPNYIGW